MTAAIMQRQLHTVIVGASQSLDAAPKGFFYFVHSSLIIRYFTQPQGGKVIS